ncbi:MAG: hypothetical protein ACJA1H_003022 [Glaciecola sp.]|jgi:hypothetical protein
MGGYTGFGMSSWIYKQGPRKAFSKRKRRPTCNTLPSYSRQFKLKPSKNEREIYIGFGLLLVILIMFGLYYKVPEFTDYSHNRAIQNQKRIERNNRFAYDFLMNSGQSRLTSNNLVGAHSEFKLAHAIYPQDDCVNQLLIETLVALCLDDTKYCSELDVILTTSK